MSLSSIVRRGVMLAGGLAVVAFAPSAGAATCPNEVFRTGPSSALPDCRAYEMVSPPDKNGGEVDGGVHKGAMAAPEQAASDGEAVTYGSTSAFTDSEPSSALVSSEYISTRAADGWRTRAIVPVQQLPKGKAKVLGEGNPEFSPFQGFSEDLSAGFLLAWNPQPDPSAPSGYYNPYLFSSGGGFQLLSDVTPPVQRPGEVNLSEGDGGFGVAYAGMSADARRVIFLANDALTPEAIPGRVNLYEWSAGRPLELVSVLPEGTVDTSGSAHVLETGLSFGGPLTYRMPVAYGALSRDGSRAFWSGGTSTGGQLFMHEIVGAGARTVEVSASQNVNVATGSAPAFYQTANPDGSLVYFTSAARLTEDSTAAGGTQDLYQYDVNTGVLSDLTVDPNAGEAAAVQGVAGIGESKGTPYVYFVAHGVLAKGATAGANNLYVVRGGAGAPVFIAALGEYDSETADYAADPQKRTSRVSPDGKLFAFQSTRPLTGYDNIPANGVTCPPPIGELQESLIPELNYENPPEGRCTEVFEYDAESARLMCVSCNPSGQPPTADSMAPETLHLYTNLVGWQSPTVQQRYLLDDGRVFFQSEDGLLAQATNGRRNVYEYEPEGVGQCAASGSGGCLYLISTGESSRDSYFADASADGRDVFLLTNQQLVSQDGDGATDMYDAREGGGFSEAVPPPCAGEACKPAVTPAPPIYGAPSSATFQGAGNIAMPVTAPKTVKKGVKRKPRKRKKGGGRKAGRARGNSGAGKPSGRSGRGRR